MLRAIEDISTTKKRLTIEIPSSRIENELNKAYAKAQREIKLPGFRPGKVPLSIITKRFGNSIKAEVLERLVPEVYIETIKKSGLIPVSLPTLDKEYDYKKDEPIVLELTLYVRPEVNDLNYKGLVIKDVPVTVTDEDIQEVLLNLAKERANYEVSNEAIEEGDLVSFDCVLGETQKQGIMIRAGSSAPYPQDFAKAFIGKKAEDTFEYEVDFSGADNIPLSGMKGTLKLTVKSVKKRVVPPIDDDFAKDLAFDNLEALKERIKEKLLYARNEGAQSKKFEQIVDKLVERNHFELPENLVQDELNFLLTIHKMSQKKKDTEEELRQKLLPLAEKNVKVSLLLQIIGEREGIQVGNEEIEEQLIKMASRYNVTPEDLLRYHLEKYGSLESIQNRAYTEKVLTRLLDYAVIEGTLSEESPSDNPKDKEDSQ